MKKCKKIVALLLALVMALALAACGGDTGNQDGGTESGGGSSADQLEVWIWDTDQLDGLQEIADLWTEQSGVPVQVNVVTWDQYWTLLEAGASGGEMADVFWMHVNEAEKYMENGILMDLTPYIEASETIDMSNYYPDAVELYSYDGKNYAIPKDHDVNVLLYNKALFDQYGYDYPDETWTWDTFYEVASGITEASGGSVYGAAMNTTNDQDSWWNIVYAYGGYIISDDGMSSGFDAPETKEAMAFVGKLIDDALAPQAMVSENGTSGLFTNDLTAMITQGNYTIKGFTNYDNADEFGVAVMPYYDANGNGQCDEGERVTVYNSLGWAANANTEHPDEAYSLIEWFGSYDMQVKQAELGVTLAGYMGADEAYAQAISEAGIDASAVQVMNDTATLVAYPFSKYTTDWQNYAREKLVNAWLDTSVMDTTLDDIAAYMNDVLATEP